MNIGIFTDTYYPQINGVAISSIILQKELTALGHKAYVITVSHPDADIKSSKVFRIPSMPFIFLKSHRVAVRYSPRTLKLIKSLKLDVIHTQTEFPVGILGKAAAKALNIPLVHTYHTMYEDYVHYIANGHIVTPRMAQRFSKIFCNSSDMVIAPTEKAKNSLIQYDVVKDIEIIPTGVNFAPFHKFSFEKSDIDELKKEAGIAETDKVIIYVGRIAKEKSIDVIINAMPKLLEKEKNAKLVIVGDGPLRKELEKLTHTLGISQRVAFLGEKPWKDIGRYYQLGKIFVSASITETQGLTFAEAMAGGLVVVGKKDESTKGLIEHGITGMLFEKDKYLANVLYQILSDDILADTIVENAYKKIEPLSAEYFGKDVLKAYEKAIELHNQKPEKTILDKLGLSKYK